MAALLGSSFSVAAGDTSDCSKHSSINLKTTLSDNDLERFQIWKKENLANLNTLQSRKLEFEQLQQRYCTGGRDVYKIATDLGWESVKLLVAGSLTAITVMASKYLIPAKPEAATTAEPESPKSDSPSATSSSALLALGTAFTNFAYNVVESVRKSKMDLNEGLNYVQDKLVQTSESKIKELPEDIRQRIQSLDRSIMSLLAQKQGDAAFRFLRRKQQVYLAFPTKTLNISHRNKEGDKEIKRILDHRVNDLISRYPEDQQPALELLVSAIRDNSIASRGSRVQAYLYGPPGTGKTTFVKQLGEALGVPVCTISMAALEPSQLLGPQHMGDDEIKMSDDEVLGKIAACYTTTGYKNPVIFFDEAGEYLSDSMGQTTGFDLNFVKRQQIQAEFKKITDPSSMNLKHIGLGIDIDTSRSTFLFASNYPLTNTALLSRISQISLSQLTRAEKEAAALGSLKQSLCERSEFLSENDILEIQKVAMKYLPFMLDEDQKRNPGARTIQAVISEFLGQVEALQEQERISGKARITDELLKKRILGSFERREPLSEASKAPKAEPADKANSPQSHDESRKCGQPQQPSCESL